VTTTGAVEAPHALPWLLAGQGPQAGAEPLHAHLARLGPCPPGSPGLVEALAGCGLRGRGGARFPTARKWEAVARRSNGRAVVVVNGAEGEPASWKDQVLMAMRPHLVLDGAMLAAQSVGASEVVLYVGGAFPHAGEALQAALRERRPPRRPRVRLVRAPPRYVAGEETAVVRFLNGGEARPAVVPPRPFERGAGGRPTLVQNVETLALAALVARYGPRAWACDPMLVTVSGAVPMPGVREVPRGVRLDEVVAMAGGRADTSPAVLVGGYFGAWVPGAAAATLRLDEESAAAAGVGLGCGVVFVLPEGACGVAETARALAFLAAESAGQCGPCRLGLPALAHLLRRVADGRPERDDAERLQRWTWQLGGGRGACKHPDGAVALVRSALGTFATDFADHLRGRPCRGRSRPPSLTVPRAAGGWR
jgi:NADH:ubiquinone oxidoreductase subunit F (NADH-binding)